VKASKDYLRCAGFEKATDRCGCKRSPKPIAIF
jgi:hypothetical protein